MKIIRKPLMDRNQNLSGKYLTIRRKKEKCLVCVYSIVVYRDGNFNNWFYSSVSTSLSFPFLSSNICFHQLTKLKTKRDLFRWKNILKRVQKQRNENILMQSPLEEKKMLNTQCVKIQTCLFK